jgi:hypothetical protein
MEFDMLAALLILTSQPVIAYILVKWVVAP